jgi:hypothetical protein
MALYRCGGRAEKPTLLWENPNPTGNFNSQTVALDLTGYEALLIYTWYGNHNISGYEGEQINYVDLEMLANNKYSLGSASKNGTWHASRLLTLSSSGLTFTNSGRFNSTWSESHNEQITTIPIKIYGLKKRMLNV